MRAGVDGLLRDKSRPPGKKPLPQSMIDRVIALTGQTPPGEATAISNERNDHQRAKPRTGCWARSLRLSPVVSFGVH